MRYVLAITCRLMITTLLVVVSLGCAGTLDTDEVAEPKVPVVETNLKSTSEASASSGEVSTDKTTAEAPSETAGNNATPACGDPKAAANYDACLAAKEEQSCLAAGGRWTRIGLSPNNLCQCPTGQEDCPCETSADCLSSCISPVDLSNWNCSENKTCASVAKVAGCWCRYHPDGSVMKACVD